MTADELLIGVDGGATEVKAHAVAADPPCSPQRFHLRAEHAMLRYEPVAGFEPVPVQQQLAEFHAGSPRLRDSERRQAARWIDATATVITDVARQCGAGRVRVGVGMPGLKTADGRGIAVLNNGPRIPDLLDRLETRLAELDIELAAPIRRLGSDADYCGLGEQYAEDGAFRDVDSAYYLGGGTGIADALKLRGRLVPFDEAREWILKSWQIPSALGPTFERLASVASLNRIWAALVGPTRGPDARYPEKAAVAGDSIARAVLNSVALVLAELIAERLHTILLGRPDAPHRGEAYARLRVDHPYRGTRLDRVVIGQRIGQIFADPAVRPYFAEPLRAHLESLLRGSGHGGPPPPADLTGDLATAYLNPAGRLPDGFLVASRLRAAPALGAAIDAVLT